SLDCNPKLAASVVEELADRAGRDREHLADRLVLEVGVVAEEQRRLLPLGQSRDLLAQRVLVAPGGLGGAEAELRPLEDAALEPSAPAPAQRGVDDDPPDPAGCGSGPPERAAPDDGVREGFLDDVLGRLGIGDDRERRAAKPGRMLAVDRLDQLERRA